MSTMLTGRDWLRRFYPVSAVDAAGSDLEALDHAIRKWSGLFPETLKMHGLRRLSVSGSLYEGSIGPELISISASSCALCERYMRVEGDCERCPLTKVRGTPCDRGEEPTPYGVFTGYGDPEPMLVLLNEAREFVLNERKAK